MMKAPRKNAALPSLSLSIPPSPTATLAVENRPSLEVIRQTEKTEAPPDESRERTKTVTFSDPEEAEDNLSDESSICQSPTWEEFGQSSKKKAKKREAAQKKKKEKKKLDEQADKTAKKPKRLSKLPPTVSSAIAPLKTTDRSLSAPELDQHLKATQGTSGRTTADPLVQDTASRKKPMDDGAKSKSRGFLANFRNSSSGLGKTASPRASVDMQSLKGRSATGHHAQAVPLSRPGEDSDFTNPRQAPSIRSNVSTSTLSGSSGEKRPTHGRSMSLLARLKGPSYLYHQNSEPEATKEEHKYPPISQPVLPGMQQSPSLQNPQRPGATLTTPLKTEKSASQENRGRPSEANIHHSRDPSSDYERTNITEPIVRQVKNVGRGVPIANEGRRRPQSYVAQVRHRYDDVNSPTLTGPVNDRHKPRVPDRASDHQIQIVSASKIDQANRQRVQNEEVQEPQSPLSDRSYASQYQDEVDQLSVSHSPFLDDEEFPAGARGWSSHASEGRTTRSGVMPPTNQIGRAVSYDHEKEGEQVNRVPKAMTRGEREPFEQPQPAHTSPQLLKQDKSADYFAFISESYAPPSLELHSPVGSRHQTSQSVEQVPDVGGDPVSWSPARGGKDESSENHLPGQVPLVVEPEAVPKSHGPIYRAQGSPATSFHCSDSDMPHLEPLAAPSVHLKKGTKPSASAPPNEDHTSGNTSERSSSSTCGDGPRMTSAITTPNSSRPHSSRGHNSMDIPSKSSQTKPVSHMDEGMGRKTYRATYTGPTDGRLASHPVVVGLDSHDDHWSRTAVPIDMDSHRGASAESHASSPSPVDTPTPVAFPTEVKSEAEEEASAAGLQRPNLPPKAHSTVDLPATSFLPPLKHQPLNPRKTTLGVASNSVPSSPPRESSPEAMAPRPFSLKASRANSANSQDSTGAMSAGAAYLQEARRSAPPSSRALRPGYSPKNSHQSPSSSRSALGSPEPPKGGEPLAKMLVQCCNCQFFHDMPSRVYECMAKPDSIVEDKLLGVSAAITTTVKCPWCTHGMTTQCCAGYAAVLFLKEKLHGK
jgi:hypothetical protein